MTTAPELDQTESEAQLVERALTAVSESRWTVGECAAKWTKRYAQGRTDADFAAMILLSADQVYQRRRVWETFADVREQFQQLKWSHFYAALTWDDAMDCLQLAEETRATVAEMKAWRRAARGEDLLSEPEATEEMNSGLMSFLSDQPAYVQDPSGERAAGGPRGPFDPNSLEAEDPRLAGFARGLDQSGDQYAPFHSGAVSAPAAETGKKPASAAPLTPEQLARRLCSTLERCEKAISDDFVEEFGNLSQPLQKRLLAALQHLEEKRSQLAGG